MPQAEQREPDARRYATLSDPFPMWRGGVLHGARIAYETWGRLNAARDNALLLFTGLSPPAHAASSPDDPRDGWWQRMVGPRAGDRHRPAVRCVRQLPRQLLRIDRPGIEPTPLPDGRTAWLSPIFRWRTLRARGMRLRARLGSSGSTRSWAPRSEAGWYWLTRRSSLVPRGDWSAFRARWPPHPSPSRCDPSSGKPSRATRTGGMATTPPTGRHTPG